MRLKAKLTIAVTGSVLLCSAALADGQTPRPISSTGTPLNQSAASPAPGSATSSESTVTNEAGSSADQNRANTQPEMQPPLRDYIGAEGRQVSTNSVEAFFQLPPPLPPSKRLETTRYLQEGRLKSSGKLPSNITAPMQTSSADVNSDKPKFKIDRAVWHIMDNMGIPMLWGNEDIDLDPSISRPYIMPPPNELAEQKSGRFDWIRRNRIKEERKTDSGTAPAPASGVTSATPFGTKASSGSMPQWTDPNMRKIPESELEGIKLPAPGSMDDDKKNP